MSRINVTLECCKVENRKDLHSIIRSQLEDTLNKNGIEYIGSNLDALNDVLTSMKDKPEFTIVNPESARENVGVYIDDLRDMLGEIGVKVTVK